MKEILAKLQRPLELASRDDYSRVTQVKGLERLVGVVVEEALAASPPEGIRGLLEELQETFKDYDLKEPSEKKKALARGREILGEIDEVLSLTPEEVRETRRVLRTSVEEVKGVGPKTYRLLKKKGIETVEDALFNLPIRYEDRRQLRKISQMSPGEWVTGVAHVLAAEEVIYPRSRRKVLEVLLGDGTGFLTAKWFQGWDFIKGRLKRGDKVVFSGEIKGYFQQREIHHPDIEVLEGATDSIHFGRIVPIYSQTEGLRQRRIRGIMYRVVTEYGPKVKSPLPPEVERRCRLVSFGRAIQEVHFPSDSRYLPELQSGTSPFHRRLAFEELFLLELALALRRRGVEERPGVAFRTEGLKLLGALLRALPFRLTRAQERVLEEIKADMARPHPMNRLLQGDVGSGKTVVALAASLIAIENGYQAAIMAPTEILAEQHYATVKELLGDLEVRTALLTSKVKGAEREAIYEGIASGEIQLLVGTHALIQEGVTFRALGFAVVDEQHRFGVMQRARLYRKGSDPDLLVMTATPIPRTLAMTLYGDMEVSVLDEMPPGRGPITTKVFREAQREEAYRVLAEEVSRGHQAYVVYPLVEESEQLDLRNATEGAEKLARRFPQWRVGLIHGRVRSEEKEAVMQAFKAGEIQVLVATTVVEVGIDVPNATVMLVEEAQRFGLAQLHQLRGRIGRGPNPSFCLLVTKRGLTEEAFRRLKVMEETRDGFRIAEEDLALRGPGDILGVRQWGIPKFRVAELPRDLRLLMEARREAFRLVEEDPDLQRPQHRALREAVLQRWSDRLDLARIG